MKKLKLIALFAAVLVGLGIYQFMKELGKPQETPRTQVVVAQKDIPENTQITADMITLRPVANEALLENHITDPESVIGLVMASDVFAGEQIVSNRLIRRGDADAAANTLSYIVEPGMRAISVSVNAASAAAYLIKPGNHVDLILNYTDELPPEDDAENREPTRVPTSQTLVQDCTVLAVGSTTGKAGSAEFTTVTLQATPEQAVYISFAEYIGNVRLSLRSSLDSESTDDTKVNLDILNNRADG